MAAQAPDTQAPEEPAVFKTSVKICGLTRVEDAELAVEGGAWALGMIMWPESKRYVAPQQAADIAEATRRSAEIAGVFVDQPLDEVVNLSNEIGLSILQLHGSEGQQYCNEVARRTGARIIKAFRVQGREVLAEMGKFYNVDFQLLDTYKAGIPGGTGEVFDWNILRGFRRGNVPIILSGGLTPENVGGAIETAGPWGVDVSSGIESEPGIKDHEKLAAFFAAVESATSPRPAPRKVVPVTGAEEEVLTLKWAEQQREREREEKERQERIVRAREQREAREAQEAADAETASEETVDAEATQEEPAASE